MADATKKAGGLMDTVKGMVGLGGKKQQQKHAAPAEESPRSSTESEIAQAGVNKPAWTMPHRYPSAKHDMPEVDVLNDLTEIEDHDGIVFEENNDDDDDDDDKKGKGGGGGGGNAFKRKLLAGKTAIEEDLTDLPGGGAAALGRTQEETPPDRCAWWSSTLYGISIGAPGFPEARPYAAGHPLPPQSQQKKQDSKQKSSKEEDDDPFERSTIFF